MITNGLIFYITNNLNLKRSDVDVETQDFDVIASLLLYLVASITFEDKFIDALNNIKALRLFKSVSIYGRVIIKCYMK